MSPRSVAALRAVPQEGAASPRALRKAFAHYSEAYLECRDHGHPWKLANIIRVRGGYERRYWCPRCKTNRIQTLTPRGFVDSNRYEYPEGFKLEGMGRLYADGRAVLRLVAIERQADRVQVLPAANAGDG